MRKPLIIIICIFLHLTSLGQEWPVSFQRYYSKDGLSSNTIYAILRDSYGFIWLGTEDGLTRFDGSSYKVYRYDANVEEGLQTNHITSLCEDAKGQIWIGTNGGGLSFYDRKMDEIKAYTHTPEGRPISTAITALSTDKNGNVWVCSYGAVFVINVRNPSQPCSEAYKKIQQIFSGAVSRYVYRDRSNNMWLSADGSIYKFSSDLKAVKHDELLEQNTSNANAFEITAITEDTRGRIWAGSGNGLFYLDQDGAVFTRFNHSNGKMGADNRMVYALAVDDKGGLWVGTDNGLDVIDTDDFTVRTFLPKPMDIRSLSHKSIRSIHVDPYGIYWVGTFQGGLSKYDTNLSQFNLKSVDILHDQSSGKNMITSFAEYGDRVLVGTDGAGVFQYVRASDHLKPLHIGRAANKKFEDLTVMTLERGSENLWIGTYQDGLFQLDLKKDKITHYPAGAQANQLTNPDIFCLKSDRYGRLWIGTNGGGINVLDAGGSIAKYTAATRGTQGYPNPPGNFIRAFAEDKRGNMWIATYGSGVSMYNSEGRINHFFDKEKNNLPSNYVLSIHIDARQRIWIGTNGNGIGLLRPGQDQFESLSEKDGLINGVIQSIVEDKSGRIWFSTNKGLSCYDPDNRVFKNYTRSAGLQEGAFMLGSGLILSDGEMFFGGQNGFNHFYPNQLKMNTNRAIVAFTDLRIDNKIIQPSQDGILTQSLLTAQEIHLEHKQNFSISFTALNLTVPEDNQYQYRLEGVDKDWIPAGKERSAYYTNLDPGKYVFQVRASNNDGVWNDEIKSIDVFVAPPWWRTAYAYVFYVILFFAILFFIRDRGIRRLKQKFALEQERIQAKQQIEQQQREAETRHELDRMKIKFLTNLSHEFRTPISLIVGPVDNLLAMESSNKRSTELSLIKRNARRLLNLVNQLLDFRKMEEHEVKLHRAEGNFVAFIEEVFQSFKDMAMSKGIDYSFATTKKDLYCVFDPDKVERILFNLIANAFKFTPKGGDIAVSLINVVTEGDQVRVYVQVKDTGIGIPEKEQQAIFESFFQHETQGNVLNQGTGIGLSIVKTFVNMHQGDIEVHSSVGNGSAFLFNLLLDRAREIPCDNVVSEESDQIYETGNMEVDVIQKPSVLIVEDDEDFRCFLKESLERDYQVYEASNGKEGWQKALFHHPNIVVSDVQMPLMNGMELALNLKQDKRTKHIPVILLTASQVENGLICGLESGAIDYITKPFDNAMLFAKINSLLILNQAFKDVYSRQVSMVGPELEIVSEKDKFLQNVLSYVYANMDNPQLSVESLSAHLAISRASLYNRLLEYSGMTPVDFIRSAKLERAALLLEKSDKNIAEIAYETGFANPNYFTKVFKSKYQMTPSEFISAKKTKVKKV
ncbi:two-component regulator propeller domain-containing protein [Sphingobacterium griseoflavum]|uniref:histidine kinase n=1 Tax=Sphingobacterium griseoflavum TaxID=1474952 RepID=A0ABQ3HUA0_9SPHI|nr:two-component regulator propeller domain-containing protein [Sphingobacterium griseoflavum]GHE35291.1 hybrid sensor histidine kinase/response regulator [Sphingobacterium griseoflavum]